MELPVALGRMISATRSWWIVLLAPLAMAGHAPAPPQGAAHPMFVVTPERRATWQRMRTEGHWLYQLASSNCALMGTAKQRYGDTGWWCAWIYLVTGDANAAGKVIAALKSRSALPPSANDVREFFSASVILTDWVWNAASEADRAAMMARLQSWAAWGAGKGLPTYVGGFRVEDEDQGASTYLGLALLDVMTRGMPGTPRWLDSTMTAGGLAPVRIGGLRATAATLSTARNAVERWATELEAGGEDLESSEYSLNTIPLLVLPNEALKTALGADSIPTLSRATCAVAARMPFELTPDMKQATEWGDIEHPHDLRALLFKRTTTAAMVEGVCKDPSTQRMLLDIWSRYGTVGFNTAEPIAHSGRLLALYDPYVVPVKLMPMGASLAASRGHLLVRNATSLASLEAQPPTHEDHDIHYVHSMSLYRNGEWVIDRPLGYGGAANGPLATNGPSYAGFGAMVNRTFDGADSSGGRWCVTGSTRGPLYSAPYWDPPPAFLTVGQRKTCYTQVDSFDVLIARDSVVITKPLRLDRYRTPDRDRLDTTGGWFVTWHPRAAPRRTGDTWTWFTRSFESVQLSVFSNGTITADSIIDEAILWKDEAVGGGVNKATVAKQLRIRTTGRTMTSVIVVGPGVLPVPALVAGGIKVGARVIPFP